MLARLTIGIGDDFPQALAVKLSVAGMRPVDAIEQMLTDALVKNIAECPFLKPLRTSRTASASYPLSASISRGRVTGIARS